MKGYKKIVLPVAMLLMMSVGKSYVVHADDMMDETTIETGENTINMSITDAEKMERLDLLSMLIYEYKVEGRKDERLRDIPDNMRRIGLMITPSTEMAPERKIPGKEYVVGIMPEGFDPMRTDVNSREFLRQLDLPIPREIIEYVLEFTGIEEEEVLFFNSYYTYDVLIIDENYDSDFIHQDYIGAYDLDENELGEVESRVNIAMGRGITAGGYGSTAGHPSNGMGTGFLTAMHGNGVINMIVNADGVSEWIGTVRAAQFTPTMDYAIVGLTLNNTISSQLPSGYSWPAGSTITNYGGLARVGDQIRVITSRSG